MYTNTCVLQTMHTTHKDYCNRGIPNLLRIGTIASVSRFYISNIARQTPHPVS